MAAAGLLKSNPKPTDKDIDDVMTNICRCGTYQRIRAAIHVAAGTRTADAAADYELIQQLKASLQASVHGAVQA
jgi:xanthine dehydrogenase iron-sulfur cluster and FAD-binding subunit A